MIGWAEASTFSTEIVTLYKFSSVGSEIWFQKAAPKPSIRVMLVVQIEELGEASPKEALTKPAAKP